MNSRSASSAAASIRGRALDLFAGPGGWDEGVRPLGIRPLGVELDRAAVETRRAAGHPTMSCDVAELDPRVFVGCELLIASPPCQSFSTAGKGDGLADVRYIVACAESLADGLDTRAAFGPCCADPRSLLVVEPLRFVLELRPTFVALEQVPPVLELWRVFAQLLERIGYRTWTGLLSAERYGVPQVRQRAFLLASLVGQPQPPRPTHQQYVFGEPARAELTLDGELLPWVSMAEALGWDGSVGRARLADGRGGSTADGRRARDLRDTSAPASALTEKARSWEYTVQHRRGGDRLEEEWTADRPADTVAGRVNRWQVWPHERPATVVAGDPRVFSPGGHVANDGRDNSRMVGRSDEAIRVSVGDAAVLQGFPREYPFRGTRSKRFQQVGNAVPPPLARAVIEALLEATP